MKTMVMEGHPGGRWYEVGADGTQATVGTILVWEPPHRLVVTWEINDRWKPGACSEVEVEFVADGPDATLVRLEHRLFESMGAEAGASLRREVDGG